MISYGPTDLPDGSIVPESTVEYEPLLHRLTEEERAQYDRTADLWVELLIEFEAAEASVGQGRNGNRYAHFYSAKQRFFLQLMMAYTPPDVIAGIETREVQEIGRLEEVTLRMRPLPGPAHIIPTGIAVTVGVSGKSFGQRQTPPWLTGCESLPCHSGWSTPATRRPVVKRNVAVIWLDFAAPGPARLLAASALGHDSPALR